MKSLSLICWLFLLVSVTGCTQVAHLPMAPENRASAAQVLMPVGYDFHVRTREMVTWQPTATDLAAVEREIGRLFQSPDRRMKGLETPRRAAPAKAPFPLSEYFVRYAGITRKGKALIVGWGDRRERPNDAPPKVPTVGSGEVLLTFGGGAYHFTFEYDCEGRRLTELQYNAPL